MGGENKSTPATSLNNPLSARVASSNAAGSILIIGRGGSITGSSSITSTTISGSGSDKSNPVISSNIEDNSDMADSIFIPLSSKVFIFLSFSTSLLALSITFLVSISAPNPIIGLVESPTTQSPSSSSGSNCIGYSGIA